MRPKSVSLIFVRFVAIAMLCLGIANAAVKDADSAAALRARHDALRDQLRHNPFQRPLYMDSSEISEGVTGDIYATIDHSFATASTALNGPASWCDILNLHFNIKYCRAVTTRHEIVLKVNIGKKQEQPLDEAYPVNFAYRVAAQTPDYLKVRLDAEQGPLDTSNYRIMLEAVPLQDGRTFLHLAYAYDYGLMGRIAMLAYLGTIGSDKVGFTVVGSQSDGKPLHVGGMRGVVERNTMRYYLAIEAYLGALSSPLQARFEKRLHDWFTAVERYPRQLHEMEQDEYLNMKRKEHLRQQSETLATVRLTPGH